jgi:CDP-diacylglycerol--serine O-phosphatidyltransferase
MDSLALRRGGRVLVPSLFTVGNMACGFYAVLASYREEFNAAATAILVGMVFDALDGRVARLVRGTSRFGVEFDSLADFLTFGVAPAGLMYSFILRDYASWSYPLAFLFALCGALRLARFNVAAQEEAGGSGAHFKGLPIPGAAGFLASFVLLYQIIEEGRPARTWRILMERIPALYGLAPVMIVVLSILMISTIPYPTFKQSQLVRPHSVWKLLGISTLALVIFIYPQNAIFLLFFAYILMGPVGWVAGGIRRMLHPQPPITAS